MGVNHSAVSRCHKHYWARLRDTNLSERNKGSEFRFNLPPLQMLGICVVEAFCSRVQVEIRSIVIKVAIPYRTESRVLVERSRTNVQIPSGAE